MNWMIYGANGYTGKLIATEAKKRGFSPILAGRRAETVRPLADQLGLKWRAFDLNHIDLTDTDLVLHCAGPFSQTSAPMADALIQGGKHYLDITGEISVFESLFARKNVGNSIVIPGVGFDVVPTDCLAAKLKEALPSATHLEMAMAGTSSLSPGTAKSMLEGFEKGGRIRENGILKEVPTGYRTKEIRFSDQTHTCSSIPWGDVSTAYHSTGIPNIIFYAGVPKLVATLSPLIELAKPMIRNASVQNFLKKQIEKHVKGPDEKLWKKGRMHLWGKVWDATGAFKELWIDLPEGYWFTMLSSLLAVEKILSGKVKPGVHTPSLAFGSGFIDEFSEVKVQWEI